MSKKGDGDDDITIRWPQPKAEFWDQYDPNERPPQDPPKLKYHGPPIVGEVPLEVRRVFGTQPPPGSQPPVPPPPRPPNSYHKKPKYWQMRGTSHMAVPNQACLVVAFGALGIAYLINKFGQGSMERFNRRMGIDLTPAAKKDYDDKIQFYAENMLLPDDSWHTDTTGEKYFNTRKHQDKGVRWDIREVDIEVWNNREMGNPFDDAL